MSDDSTEGVYMPMSEEVMVLPATTVPKLAQLFLDASPNLSKEARDEISDYLILHVDPSGRANEFEDIFARALSEGRIVIAAFEKDGQRDHALHVMRDDGSHFDLGGIPQ